MLSIRAFGRRVVHCLSIYLVCIVVWPMLFSLFFADVEIRHPRITTKEELKTVL